MPFFVQIYRGLKSCTSLIENVSLRVPPSHFREFPLLCACLSNTVLLLGAPMLQTWRWVKISTYLHVEAFLLITSILLIVHRMNYYFYYYYAIIFYVITLMCIIIIITIIFLPLLI
jgi:hypothetical protein